MKNAVTQEQIDKIIQQTHFVADTYFDKSTVVVAKLPCGFVITESSGAVDKANYDKKIGIEICKQRIINKIWGLEGYRLQSKIYDTKEFQRRAKAANLLSEEKIEKTVSEWHLEDINKKF